MNFIVKGWIEIEEFSIFQSTTCSANRKSQSATSRLRFIRFWKGVLDTTLYCVLHASILQCENRFIFYHLNLISICAVYLNSHIFSFFPTFKSEIYDFTCLPAFLVFYYGWELLYLYTSFCSAFTAFAFFLGDYSPRGWCLEYWMNLKGKVWKEIWWKKEC